MLYDQSLWSLVDQRFKSLQKTVVCWKVTRLLLGSLSAFPDNFMKIRQQPFTRSRSVCGGVTRRPPMADCGGARVHTLRKQQDNEHKQMPPFLPPSLPVLFPPVVCVSSTIITHLLGLIAFAQLCKSSLKSLLWVVSSTQQHIEKDGISFRFHMTGKKRGFTESLWKVCDQGSDKSCGMRCKVKLSVTGWFISTQRTFKRRCNVSSCVSDQNPASVRCLSLWGCWMIRHIWTNANISRLMGSCHCGAKKHLLGRSFQDLAKCAAQKWEDWIKYAFVSMWRKQFLVDDQHDPIDNDRILMGD